MHFEKKRLKIPLFQCSDDVFPQLQRSRTINLRFKPMVSPGNAWLYNLRSFKSHANKLQNRVYQAEGKLQENTAKFYTNNTQTAKLTDRTDEKKYLLKKQLCMNYTPTK